MKKKWVIMAVISGTFITTVTAFGQVITKQIEVIYNDIKIVVDGAEKTPPADMKPFVYNGRTYVSLRFVGEALGKTVEWDRVKNKVIIGDAVEKVNIEKTVKSTNNEVEITIPSGWVIPSELEKPEMFSAEESEKEAIIQIIEESKMSFKDGFTIEEYADASTEASAGDKKTITLPQKTIISGYNALQFEATQEVDATKQKALVTIIETKKNFFAVYCYSNNANYDKYKDDFIKTTNSIKITD